LETLPRDARVGVRVFTDLGIVRVGIVGIVTVISGAKRAGCWVRFPAGKLRGEESRAPPAEGTLHGR
jgi:hypothetical protein